MYQKFSDFLESLHISILETSKVFRIFCEVLVKHCGSILETTLLIAKQCFAEYSDSLSECANEKSLFQLRLENDKQFRQRIKDAFSFLRNSSTLEGIENILRNLITTNFKIREIYKETWILGHEDERLGETMILGSPQDRFFFIVEFEDQIQEDELGYIYSIIKIYKPAHVGFRIINGNMDQ